MHRVVLRFLVGGLLIVLALVFFAWILTPKQQDATPRELALRSFDAGNVDYEALQQKYIDEIRVSSPDKVIDLLKSDADSSPLASTVCHDILHSIGREAFLKYDSLEAVMTYSDDFCNSGFLHGVFEAYFTQELVLPTDLSKLCSDSTHLTRLFDVWQCNHGIGHGLMYYTDGLLEKSLTLCNSLGGDDQDSCKNGAYMEAFNAEVLSGEQQLVTKDPRDICKAATEAKSDCYTYVAAFWSQINEIAFSGMFLLCTEVESEYEDSCVAGIGGEAMKRNMLNPMEVFALCEGASSLTHIHPCVYGAVSMYMNQQGSSESAEPLCEELSWSLKGTCVSTTLQKKEFFAKRD